jgi:predicted ATPase
VLVATYSPILLALPGATILEIDDDGEIRRVDYDEALPVRLTREFLAAPDRVLRFIHSESARGAAEHCRSVLECLTG